MVHAKAFNEACRVKMNVDMSNRTYKHPTQDSVRASFTAVPEFKNATYSSSSL